MEVSITDVTDVEKEIHIEATASELAPHFEKAYKQQQAKIEIKGFRKGKAPLDMVKKIYGEAIEYDSLNHVASDMYRTIVEERHIHPIGEPVLVDMNYKRGETLTFKVKYEIKPKVELKEYKGIAVEKSIHPVTDKEVAAEILRLRKSNSTLQEVEAASDDEHIVTADVQQLDEAGSPLIGKKTSGARLYLNDETIFPQIKETLRGVKAGETRKTTVHTEHKETPETNHLEITAKKIEKVNLPEFNDEFVKSVTKEKVTSAEAFTKQLREDLENYWNDRTERKLLDDIIGEVVRRHDFIVPEALVKGFLDSLVEDVKNRYPNKKLPADFKEEEFREHNRGYAVFQSKWYLIRERMIEAEGLRVEDADLQQLAEKDAPKVGIEPERLLEFYKSSDATKDRVLSEKLQNFLKQHSVITENVVEEGVEQP
jgi:trigger factor